MIAKKDLIIGSHYVGYCRNAHVARWTGKKFLYIRHKFSDWFMEEINHPEDDDYYYDLFVPVRMVDDLTEDEAIGVGGVMGELNDKAKR